MPVWTPGSYKVREFARNISSVHLRTKKDEYEIEKSNKNTWKTEGIGKESFTISYDVYAFTYGVRESYVDQYMAFLHGVSVFGYIEGLQNKDLVLSYQIPEEWDVHFPRCLPRFTIHP